MGVYYGDYIPIAIYCHHQNDSCIKMGSDESHFDVSLTVKHRHKTVSTNHDLFEVKGEPKRNRTKAPLLTSITPYHWAQTG